MRMSERFARTVGPPLLDFANANGTQTTIPLSPSATPPRDTHARALAHSTPANRRMNTTQPTGDELASVGYRGHSEDEVDQAEPERSRVSLQARGSNG